MIEKILKLRRIEKLSKKMNKYFANLRNANALKTSIEMFLYNIGLTRDYYNVVHLNCIFIFLYIYIIYLYFFNLKH